MTTIFKAYDIRAVVPDQLDAELARKIGSAFAAFAKSPTILIGNDMRPSGPELVAAFSDGVTSAGVDVVLLGLVSTDELFLRHWCAGRPGRHVHRLAQPGPLQRHQAVPVRGQAGGGRVRPAGDPTGGRDG